MIKNLLKSLSKKVMKVKIIFSEW